jgi:hypothetical protein
MTGAGLEVVAAAQEWRRAWLTGGADQGLIAEQTLLDALVRLESDRGDATSADVTPDRVRSIMRIGRDELLGATGRRRMLLVEFIDDAAARAFDGLTAREVVELLDAVVEYAEANEAAHRGRT